MTVLDLTTLTLAVGEHDSGSGEMCLLEAVSYIAGESWSDHPECVSPILRAYGRDLNDVLPDEARQRLVPFIPRLLNTAGDGLDERRSYMAVDWLIRTYLPAWLRLIPALVGQAELIAAAPEITDLATVCGVGVLVREAKSQVAAARGVVSDAAWDVAWTVTRAAAGNAARSAAGEAAWVAAGDAAWYAARFATQGTAGDAAFATGNAAEAFLAPTVAVLQDSAIDLFDRMLTVTK